MRKIWSDKAWNDYLYWQNQDKKTVRRINLFIKDDDTNRIVYRIEKGNLEIAQCRIHYEKP